MAKTQSNDELLHEKKDELTQKTQAVSATGALENQGGNIWLEHAVLNADEAKPDALLSLQKSHGNYQVQRNFDKAENAETITNPRGELNKYVSDEIQRARSGGAPLSSDLRSKMGKQLGHNFDRVRIHTDQKSDTLNKQLQARAFTIGNNIFFRQGAYAPQSSRGRHTLMHELTHVIQQSPGETTGGKLRLGKPNDKFEQEADHVATGHRAALKSGQAVQRDVVQRNFFDDIKQNIAGLFNRGGSSTNSTGGSTNATAPTLPSGVSADEWKQIQKLGVTDKSEWEGFETNERNIIKQALTNEQQIAKKLIEAAKNDTWPLDENDAAIYSLDSIKLIEGVIWVTFSDWNTKISAAHRKELLALAASEPSYIRGLAGAALDSKWPKDENDAEITDDAKLKEIYDEIKVTFLDWVKTKKEHRKVLFEVSGESFSKELASASITDVWPKDGADKDIDKAETAKKIREDIKVNLTQWNTISKKALRGYLLANSDKNFIAELGQAALANKWPKDGNDADIVAEANVVKIREKIKINLSIWNDIGDKNHRKYLLNLAEKPYAVELGKAALAGKWPKGETDDLNSDTEIKKIKDKMKVSFESWSTVAVPDRRKNLLSCANTMQADYLKELVSNAVYNRWPLDGSDNDVADMTKWNAIKGVAKSMSIPYWNGFSMDTRRDVLAAGSDTERKNLINSANYERNSGEGALEKAGEVSEHALVDAGTDTLGMTSSILSASKGTADNPDLDRASGIVGAVGDATSMLASGTSFIGNIAKIRRGQKMAGGENYSKAAKEVGKKERKKGIWGAVQSGIGFVGSGFGLGGNITKAADPESDGATATSGGLGAVGGIFGMIGSALGVGKTSASVHSSRRRSKAARGAIKTAPSGGALTDEQKKLNRVAEFTSKNQNKSGKGIEIAKGLTSGLGSLFGTIGSIAGIFSKETGMAMDIASSVTSLGSLGLGLTQLGVESKYKPKDSDLDTQATYLIDLLKLGNDPGTKDKGQEAANFTVDVLGIKLLQKNDHTTWAVWIEEDEAAARDLIKSKLSKF